MERGASPVLAARGAEGGGTDADDGRREVRGARGRMRTGLASFGDTCALAGVALLGCVVLVALGTVGSLLWMLVAER
jgi:hypothetical protein